MLGNWQLVVATCHLAATSVLVRRTSFVCLPRSYTFGLPLVRRSSVVAAVRDSVRLVRVRLSVLFVFFWSCVTWRWSALIYWNWLFCVMKVNWTDNSRIWILSYVFMLIILSVLRNSGCILVNWTFSALMRGYRIRAWADEVRSLLVTTVSCCWACFLLIVVWITFANNNFIVFVDCRSFITFCSTVILMRSPSCIFIVPASRRIRWLLASVVL